MNLLGKKRDEVKNEPPNRNKPSCPYPEEQADEKMWRESMARIQDEYYYWRQMRIKRFAMYVAILVTFLMLGIRLLNKF